MELTASARAKLAGPGFAHVATVMVDGAPHVAPVWVDLDGDHVVVVAWVDSVKHRNLRRDPRVALSVTHHQDPYDKLDLRGRVVEMVEGAPAEDQIRAVSLKYRQRPYEVAPGERLVILRIEPEVAFEQTFTESQRQRLEKALGELSRSPAPVRAALRELLAALAEAGDGDRRAISELLAAARGDGDLGRAEAALS